MIYSIKRKIAFPTRGRALSHDTRVMRISLRDRNPPPLDMRVRGTSLRKGRLVAARMPLTRRGRSKALPYR